jgi:hypothetical protein
LELGEPEQAGWGDAALQTGLAQDGAIEANDVARRAVGVHFGDEAGEASDHGGLGVDLEGAGALWRVFGKEPPFGGAAPEEAVLGAEGIVDSGIFFDPIEDVGEAFLGVFDAEEFGGDSGLELGRGHGRCLGGARGKEH